MVLISSDKKFNNCNAPEEDWNHLDNGYEFVYSSYSLGKNSSCLYLYYFTKVHKEIYNTFSPTPPQDLVYIIFVRILVVPHLPPHLLPKITYNYYFLLLFHFCFPKFLWKCHWQGFYMTNKYARNRNKP